MYPLYHPHILITVPSDIAFVVDLLNIRFQTHNLFYNVVDITATKAMGEDLMSKNSKAMSLIILSCEDHIIRLFGSDDLAASAWRSLKQQYGHVGFSARHLAFQSLVSNSLATCDNIDTYIDQFRTHVTTLSQMTSMPLPQWLLLSILINNVGNTFEAWSQSIMQQLRVKTISENTNTYLEEVIASLIDEARRVNTGAGSQNQNTALTARKPAKTKPICRYCGKIHKSENCWQEFPEKKPSARLSTSTTTTAATSSQNNNTTYSPSNIAFLSKNQNHLCDSWILDSGATQHMCNNKSQFTHIEPFSTTITIANNTKMNATGKGDVTLTTRNGTSFKLINVLLVPNLASNLLSVCCATQNPHMSFNFVNGECNIMHQNKLLATATKHDSLLVLETGNNYAHVTKTTDTLTWHKRLGHLNQDYMTKGSIKSVVGRVEEFTCEACLKNKSTRIISRKPLIKAKRPLEMIHSDLAGPITPLSLGGNKYVITFTDDFSRFSWVFPCREKSKCLDIFKVFKEAVENELNHKIAFVHCDNGGEYSSKEWKQFTQQHGIQMLYTVPHTPEQNGVAERLNRTLFNMTRCFLNDSNRLTKPLWAELVRTSCYIKNRLPCSSNEQFKSAYEMLFNRPPSLSHLRIIGSTCYSNKTGKNVGKLDERADKCLLVGYESDNIFRVYDPSSRKVFRSRDLVIKEQMHYDQNESSESNSIDLREDINVHQETVHLDLNSSNHNIQNDENNPLLRNNSPIIPSPQINTPRRDFDISTLLIVIM